MFKFGLKIVVFSLGIVSCIGLLQMAAAQAENDEEADTPSEIPVPDGGFTIVLRGPTSEKSQVVQVSKGGKEKNIIGLTVKLPKNTPISFRVDQVNTVLYNVEISVDEEMPVTSEQDQVTTKGIAEFVKTLDKLSSGNRKNKKILKAENTFKTKVQQVWQLNNELDDFLYTSEKSGFYNKDTAKKFEEIKDKARKAAANNKLLSKGTNQEIRKIGEAAIAEVRKAYTDAKTSVPAWVPKDLSDTANPNENAKKIALVFVETANKLHQIETATWHKTDNEDRGLAETIKYKCVITPSNITPSEKHPKLLANKEIVVTVIPTEVLYNINFTAGPFITNLHDESYVNIKNRIALGSQSHISQSLGILANIPLWSCDFPDFRGAIAISAGLGNVVSIGDQSVSLNFKEAEPVVGLSLLFVGKTSDSSLVLTSGVITKSVQRLSGYYLGDTYPMGELTAPVNRFSWFCGVTFSYDILGKLGIKK